MSSDSNNDRLFILVLEVCSDLGCCLDAVHHGHTKVRKDDAVPHSVLVCLFYLVHGLFPMNAEVHLEVCVDA